MRFPQITGLVSTALAMTLIACGDSEGPTTPQPRVVEIFEVTAVSPDRLDAYPGTLRAVERSTLAFEASGVIQTLTVDLGDRFRSGDVLGTVDDQSARLALENAQAQVREAEAERVDADLDFRRRDTLSGTGAISPSELDAARARLDRAQARQAALEASVASAERRVRDTRLIATFDGEVVDRLAEPSEVVAVGQPVLRVIGAGSGLEAVTSVPEPALAHVSLGDRMAIRSTRSESLIDGELKEVGQDASSAGLYPLTLRLSDSSSLRSGERVDVLLPSGTAVGVFIPLTSYRPLADSEHAEVFLIDEAASTVSIRSVRIGEVTDRGVRVLDGLEPGESIVRRGLSVLRDGETVRVIDPEIARFNP